MTPKGQVERERVRLEAADRFARGEATAQVAATLRVGERQVRKWRQAWRQGGAQALRSKGPHSVERLSPAQWDSLVRELERGPLALGWSEDQCWSLGRIHVVIARRFHIGYTVQGVWTYCSATAGPCRFRCARRWSATTTR